MGSAAGKLSPLPLLPLQRPLRRGRVKRARRARRSGESGCGFRDCTKPISRNLRRSEPRPVFAGKAANDDGGVIYSHNRASGEKEKEGRKEGRKERNMGQDISKTGYTLLDE